MPAQRVKGRAEGRRCHGVAWARDLRHLPGYWPSFFLIFLYDLQFSLIRKNWQRCAKILS
jgi:hypothetical protein